MSKLRKSPGHELHMMSLTWFAHDAATSSILSAMTTFAYDGLATFGEAGTGGSSNSIF